MLKEIFLTKGKILFLSVHDNMNFLVFRFYKEMTEGRMLSAINFYFIKKIWIYHKFY